MPSEATITQMMEIFTEVIDLGGVEERTAIVPNLSVTDAAPTGLTGFVIVQDDRDGDNILAKTVPGVIYANSDKVNVLFIRGTEPIAFQQGSQSTNAGLWEIVPSTSTDIFYDKGDVGIGNITPERPLHVTGSDGSVATFPASLGARDFLIVENAGNANIGLIGSTTSQCGLKMYEDGTATFQGALLYDNTSNFMAIHTANTEKVRVDTNGNIGIGTTGPDAKLDVLATTTQLRLTHTDGSTFVDLTLDTNHDLTITPSSTGQVIFQPTTDSVDFLQVLDANGGTPIINIDSTNERVGLGTAAPTSLLNLVGASSPSIVIVDTTNTVTFRVSAQNNFGVFGTTSNHNVEIRTNNLPAMVLTSGQLVGFGTGSPGGKVEVDQASTTAAIPVIVFDQADVSEEMFEFQSTIGVGNAIEAIGAKTLTTTHFIKVTLPGPLTRYFPVGTIA